MPGSNTELADFLRRARAARDPANTGLPADGRVRRVPGLRREEVALLAGVSTDYYTRLEQGRPLIPSDHVLEALSRALDLDHTARAHLRNLVGMSRMPADRREAGGQQVRPGLLQLMDTLDSHPVIILGRLFRVLAANRLARRLFADFPRMRSSDRNYARWMLLSSEARELFCDWEFEARNVVEALRFDIGGRADQEEAAELIDALVSQSPEFRTWWSEHRVHQRTFGTKELDHPVVGRLSLDYETLTPPGDPQRTLFIYSARPGSPSRAALDRLVAFGD